MLFRSGITAAVAVAAVCAAVGCDDDDNGTNPSQETFAATLSGAAERPTPVTTSATGTATLSFAGSGAIGYTLNVTGLLSAATMAHIHGPAGVAAAAQIIAPLSISGITTSGTSTGTVSSTVVATISLDSLKKLLRNGNAYVNVHTSGFPDGEIRGQIIAQ
jgi:hypothetical protein